MSDVQKRAEELLKLRPEELAGELINIYSKPELTDNDAEMLAIILAKLWKRR